MPSRPTRRTTTTAMPLLLAAALLTVVTIATANDTGNGQDQDTDHVITANGPLPEDAHTAQESIFDDEGEDEQTVGSKLELGLRNDFNDALAPPDLSCPADTNDDELVNVTDLTLVLSAWGPCGMLDNTCPADIIPDGQVDLRDLLRVLTDWGACPRQR